MDMEVGMVQADPATPRENTNLNQDIMVNHTASEEATVDGACKRTHASMTH
jgi:hypothetical protein